jgi:hyperosmotically inducible periplasmic protein
MNLSASFFLILVAAIGQCCAGTPAFATPSDEAINASIAKTYVFKTYLHDESVSATAKDGVVTLTGTVADVSQRVLAQETVANIPGVTSVDNQISTVAEIAAEKADYWIGKKLKLTLLFHRHVNATGTSVEVKDGVVTLRGQAVSEAQRDLTGEFAKDIEGVKEVRNQMTVAPTPVQEERTAGEKLDDASVVALVKTALVNHRSTSAISTNVVARDGEITLTGIAKNAAEIALVTKLVTDIKGVTTVNNLMMIDESKIK